MDTFTVFSADAATAEVVAMDMGTVITVDALDVETDKEKKF